MNRIDRLVAVLTTLQSKRFVTTEYIANKYEISNRTVYRDLKALGEIGVPIYFEKDKGYTILQSFFLPPIALTSEEANALILTTSLSNKFSDSITQSHVENALNKIKAVLRTTEKDKADYLQSQIKIYQPPNEQKGASYLTEIQNAIVNKQILTIEYTNNKKEISNREIEAIGLTFYSNQWHLIAWCWKRNAYRDFKVNQINSLLIKKDMFKKLDHYDINDYIRSLK